jgi:uncharacterized membrane protein
LTVPTKGCSRNASCGLICVCLRLVSGVLCLVSCVVLGFFVFFCVFFLSSSSVLCTQMLPVSHDCPFLIAPKVSLILYNYGLHEKLISIIIKLRKGYFPVVRMTEGK